MHGDTIDMFADEPPPCVAWSETKLGVKRESGDDGDEMAGLHKEATHVVRVNANADAFWVEVDADHTDSHSRLAVHGGESHPLLLLR